MKRNLICAAAVAVAMLSAFTAQAQTPVGTAFTYQGQLKQGGSPASGSFTMVFKLWNDPTLSAQTNQVGPTLAFDGIGGNSSPVSVNNGLFTTSLDFGAAPYTANQARWLEITVGGTTLTPRQPLTPTPFALNTRGVAVDAAGNVGIGTNAPSANLDVAASNPFAPSIVTRGGRDFGVPPGENMTFGHWDGNTSTIELNIDSAGKVSVGTGTANNQLTVAGNADVSGNVGVGTTTPQSRLDVNGNTLFRGQMGIGYGASPTPLHSQEALYINSNNPIGSIIGLNGTTSGGHYYEIVSAGTGASTTAGSLGIFDFNANAYRLSINASGNVGIGTTAPVNKLSVSGSADFSGNVGIGTTSPGVQLDVVASGDAIHGTANGGFQTAGVVGVSDVTDGNGVIGECNLGGIAYGVWGSSTTGYAGWFDGAVNVNGTLSKSAGSFRIDHPLDPANKYLSHSFVESPDMKNIYDGVVNTDSNGDAAVMLPDWFEPLNRDFRYQLTIVDATRFAQARVSQEIQGNRFSIKTDKPDIKVSWQVTGIRHDAYAEKHRIPVEEDKAMSQRGQYLHPDLFGKTPEFSIGKRQTPATIAGKSAK